MKLAGLQKLACLAISGSMRKNPREKSSQLPVETVELTEVVKNGSNVRRLERRERWIKGHLERGRMRFANLMLYFIQILTAWMTARG